MGSVSGDAPANAQALADLALAMEGGDGFTNRLAALEKAKRAHQQAYDQFRVGNDARAALDDAERLKAQATEIIAKAKKDAEEIAQAAKKASDKIREAADQYHSDLIGDANQTCKSAELYYNSKVAEANKLKAEAQAQHNDAVQLLAKHDKMYNEVQTAKAEVETIRNDLKASKDLFLKKHKTLSDFLAKMK